MCTCNACECGVMHVCAREHGREDPLLRRIASMSVQENGHVYVCMHACMVEHSRTHVVKTMLFGG
jgi:hypothetical protein